MVHAANPTSEVWTAIGWNGTSSLLAADLHFNRLIRHSKILGITLPSDFFKIVFEKIINIQTPEKMNFNELQTPFIVKVTITSNGEISLLPRSNKVWRDLPLNAISMSMPDISTPILGTKHASWHHYLNAIEQAKINGADLSLLFSNNFLIDGDRCTPVILDNDGVAYYPKNSDGALDSVTLEQLRQEIEISGIPIREAKISLDMIMRSSEMIVLGSGIGVGSIGKIDGTIIGKPNGKLFQIAKKAWLNRLKLDWISIEDMGE